MTTDIVRRSDTLLLAAGQNTVEGVMDVVRNLLTNPDAEIVSLTISPTEVKVLWNGSPEAVLTTEPTEGDVYDILESLPMTEVAGSDPAKALGAAALEVEGRGLVITHTLAAPKSRLFRWLGVEDVLARPEHVGGGVLRCNPRIAADEVYFLAGPASAAPISAARHAVRVFMEPS